jgi:hypothetical protein
MDIVEFFHVFELGEIKEKLTNTENISASNNLFKWIEENNIKTEYYHVAKKILDEKFEEWKSLGLPEYIWEVMEIVKKDLLDEINKGKPSCIASVRYVGKKCGWIQGTDPKKNRPKVVKTNKILNLCCTLGMLKKTKNMKVGAGVTPRYRIMLASNEAVTERWKKCLENGITNYAKVTKGAISGVVGEAEAANICRRER